MPETLIAVEEAYGKVFAAVAAEVSAPVSPLRVSQLVNVPVPVC